MYISITEGQSFIILGAVAGYSLKIVQQYYNSVQKFSRKFHALDCSLKSVHTQHCK